MFECIRRSTESNRIVSSSKELQSYFLTIHLEIAALRKGLTFSFWEVGLPISTCRCAFIFVKRGWNNSRDGNRATHSILFKSLDRWQNDVETSRIPRTPAEQMTQPEKILPWSLKRMAGWINILKEELSRHENSFISYWIRSFAFFFHTWYLCGSSDPFGGNAGPPQNIPK